jgi:hypothetical protein
VVTEWTVDRVRRRHAVDRVAGRRSRAEDRPARGRRRTGVVAGLAPARLRGEGRRPRRFVHDR